MALIPLQTDIERALTDFIRSEINNNSYDIKFSLGYWTNTTDREGQNVEIIEVEGSKYETEEVRIVPMSIESYVGNITNIEGLLNADYTIPLTFQIYVDDQDHFDDAINAINEFKNNLRGQIKRLEVSHNNVTETFTAVTSTDNLTPQGNLSIMMGQTYAFAGLNISFDISKDINYGNQVWIYLAEYDDTTGETLPDNLPTDYNRIFALAPSFNRTNNPEAFQNFNTSDVVHIVKDTEYTFAMQMFIKDDDFHWGLLEEVINKNSLNKPYLLKLDFKNYNINNELVTKFSFTDPVIILDATPSFSIGEPQYLEVAFGKYLTESEIQDPGVTPGLPLLTSPTYVTDSITTTFTNPTMEPDVLGVYASAQFTNASTTETADMQVCVGSQCKIETDVEPGETRTFNFNGLSHNTNYVATAVLLGDGESFNNSEPTTEPFTTLAIAEPSNLTSTIGAANSSGFAFAIENPNPYPIEVFVNYQSSVSQPFLVNADTQSQFNYVNESLTQGTNATFNLTFSTLGEYGNILTFEGQDFTIAIPQDPQVATPSIENVQITRTDLDVTVTFDVVNEYFRSVNLYVVQGTSTPSSTNFDYSELDVPANGVNGDTVTFSKTFTDSSTFGTIQQFRAVATREGELDSEVQVIGPTLPIPLTGDLDVSWVPNTDTDSFKITFDVTNNNTYFTRFDIALYLNGVEVPNSSRSTVSALYDGLDPSDQPLRLDFIDGDNDPNRPPLVINSNSPSDEYTLGVRSKSDDREDTSIKFYEGYLARPMVLPAIFNVTTTSNSNDSFIRFQVRNLDEYSGRIYYGVSTSTSPFTISNFVAVGSAGTSSADSGVLQYTVNDFDLTDNHYIHIYADDGNSQHLLQSGRIVSGAITPAALQETYTVRFIDYNGTVLKEEQVVEGDNATAPSNPSRTGYTFEGWDKTFTNVQSNLDVNAEYTPIQYTITYVLDGGTNSGLNPSTYTTEQTITFENATKDYHTFEGWFTDSGFTQSITQIPQGSFGNVTVYAKLEQIQLDNYVVSVTNTTTDSITLSITNPSSNPSDGGASTFVTLRDSSGNLVETGTTYILPPGNSDSVTFNNLSDNTTYEVGGNGTNNAIVTVDNQGNYLSNEQNAFNVTTPENIGDKTLRVKLNIFGPTTTASVGWAINGNTQSSITANNDSFTTFSTTLFNTDDVTITAPQTAGGQSFLNFVVNGVTKTVPTFSITETVGDGLDIEINYQ